MRTAEVQTEVKKAIEAARQYAANFRSPPRRVSALDTLPWLALGLIAGSAAMYFLDPRNGSQRRGEVADLAKKAGDWTGDQLNRLQDGAKQLVAGASEEAKDYVH